MPELPDGLAALVADLEHLGFELEREEWLPWPAGGEIQLQRSVVGGVTGVRLSQDRGCWDVTVQIGRWWYEPFRSLRALDGLPHQQRALNDAERRAATIELVERYTGDPAQRKAIEDRAKLLSDAYLRWTAGEGEYPPR